MKTFHCILASCSLLCCLLICAFQPPAVLDYPVLFVSRAIPCCGSSYLSEANALPGVGGFSKFQVAAPGHLCIWYPGGTVDTLVDGSHPEAASLFLIDVSAPCLSWDATKIVFAGLPEGNYVPGNNQMTPQEHNAWRIYTINTDGTDLKQITGLPGVPGSDQGLDLSQFSPLAHGLLTGYDDTDPAWLPDGRIVFSSTRFPGLSMYNRIRTTNLYVVQDDGTGLHRITSEKNGADRPVVDPVTGKIVFSRWWRNFYWPYEGMEAEPHPLYTEGWRHKDGLTSSIFSVLDGQTYMFNNNVFNLTEINPDGTGLRLFSMYNRELSRNNCYGGAFAPDGHFVGNWFPIEHLTESSGFGGLKKYFRGASRRPEHLTGVTSYGNLNYYVDDPPSYGVFVGSYAAEPFVLEDGRILFSKADNPDQDYGIYLMEGDGSNSQLILDWPGFTELRAQLVKPRPAPPIISDKITAVANLLPPRDETDLFDEGHFSFDCQNIYFNAPVDVPIISAPKVGEAGSVRFFAAPLRDQQFGSVEALDYPILYNEIPVDEFGRVLEENAPAHVPLFEQARSADSLGYFIPRTGGGIMNGAAHVMGLNYGRPGERSTCVGCHAGHSLIEVPDTPEALMFTNLAPGAQVEASSAHTDPGYTIDRKNHTTVNHWFSAAGEDPAGQWLQLNWRVPVWAKQVVLHAVPDSYGVTVHRCRVTLYAQADFTGAVFTRLVDENLSQDGTVLLLPAPLPIQSMRLEFLNSSGKMLSWECAAIGDVEVIASPVDPIRFQEITDCNGTVYGTAVVDTCGVCLQPGDPLFNDCLTDVQDYLLSRKTTVFPNPARDMLTVETGGATRVKEVLLLDMYGRILQREYPNGGSFRVDISQLPVGVHLLQIHTARARISRRFVKH